MRAIIETGGKQFAVAPNQTIRVPSMTGDPGDKVTFERVLYAAGSDAVHVGSPHVDGASVTAEIVKHGRGKKITVFKYKRRKRYSRKKGHRQNFTELRVTGVNVDSKRRAEEGDLFVCQDCGKEYKTERGLAQHAAREHGESSERE
jgi:large subunit ribosomal protein L21